MSAEQIAAALKKNNVQVVAYLPESWLSHLLEFMESDRAFKMVRLAREEEGIGVCCGVALAGKRSVLIIQNAGLLSAGNTLTTLAQAYALPFLMLMSYRGDWRDPSFYQVPKGRATEPVLEAYGIPYVVTHDVKDWDDLIRKALTYAEALPGPYALLLGQEDLD